MNLEPNMYIRTKEGKIDKVLEINTEDFDEPVVRLASYPIGMYQGMFEYKKASHNIIDLIEEGDYVNGYPIYEIIEYEDNTRAIVIGDDNKSIIWEESSQYVKSIVTKEQFSSISYEVSK